MSNQQGQSTKSADTNKNDHVEATWVVTRAPFTALLKGAERTITIAGAMPSMFGLRFERGVQVLAGHVDLGASGQQFVTLEQLPARVAAMREPERAREVQRLLDEVRRSYPLLFPREVIEQLDPKLLTGQAWPAAAAAMFRAVGTMRELVRQHYQALRDGAEHGTHRLSLEALVAHPDVPDDVKQLARHRLTAWNQQVAV